MYKKTAITSWITAICLCLVTVITAISQHHVTYQVLISIISYLGVYAISLYLSKSNSTEKIILTLVNILAVILLAGMAYSAVMKYHGLLMVSMVMISLIGVIAAVFAIWYNNKFKKANSES
ncbi:hypothetical protein [Secundilactobacillus odoratitofui]|uniref:hypothetical protein n=1 Tax=Secundilactobacillus odoratitofui TaxID=480930 RepID=UPI0007053097|nr:hypothetical protein [Secundilactobacillus odoratitofui]